MSIKSSIPGIKRSEMSPEVGNELISIKLPRSMAAFIAEDFGTLADEAMKPDAPSHMMLRGLAWRMIAVMVKEELVKSLVKPEQQ